MVFTTGTGIKLDDRPALSPTYTYMRTREHVQTCLDPDVPTILLSISRLQLRCETSNGPRRPSTLSYSTPVCLENSPPYKHFPEISELNQQKVYHINQNAI